MINQKTPTSALLAGAFLLSLTTVDANAVATVDGRCEYRAANPERSKADAKTRGLTPGAMYSISAADGIGGPQVATLAGEAQRSFDSNPGDIAGGDTAISAGSAASGSVTFTVRDAGGSEVASRIVNCRMR